MRIDRAKLDKAFSKLSDFVAGDKQVPGVLLNIVKTEDGLGSDGVQTVLDSDGQVSESEGLPIGSKGILKLCYSDTTKHWVEEIETVVEPGDVLGGVVVDYAQLQRAINNCKTPSTIRVSDVQFVFTSNNDGKNIIKIKADMYSVTEDDDGNEVRTKKAVKQMDVLWYTTDANKRTEVLARPDYEAVFDSEKALVTDEISRKEFIEALSKTSASDGKVIYFSDKSDSVFTSNKAHVTLYTMHKKEITEDVESELRAKTESVVLDDLRTRYADRLAGVAEGIKQSIRERLLNVSDTIDEGIVEAEYQKGINEKCKEFFKDEIKFQVSSASDMSITEEQYNATVDKQYSEQYKKMVDTKYAELLPNVDRNLHSKLVITQPMAKAIIGILNKTTASTINIYTSSNPNEKADVIYCTIFVDSQEDNERFGLWFGMGRVNQQHAKSLANYIGAGYRTYQIVFLRDFLMEAIKSARDATKNDNTDLKFSKLNTFLPSGEPNYELVISSESSSASVSDKYSVDCEDVVDINGTLGSDNMKINVSLTIIAEMLEQLKTKFVAFDIDDTESAYILRLAEIDNEKLMAENMKAKEEHKGELVNGALPLSVKIDYRSKTLGTVQYTTLRKNR